MSLSVVSGSSSTTTATTARKRAARRHTASASTVATVSSEIWLIVCMQLAHSPHAVFRLMMASKGVRSAFLENGAASDAWWLAFFRQVCAYQTGLKHSNFRKRLLAYERRGQLRHVDILRAVFSPRCERCGTRFGHRLLRPFGLRVCAGCLPHCVVSNHALEQDYGVAFFELLEAYARLGGPLLPLDAFQNETTALGRLLLPGQSEWRFFAFDFTYYAVEGQYHEQDRLRLTDAAAAAVSANTHTTRIRRNALVFLWRADVERALGCSLQSLTAAQAVRRRAAALLSARVRRLGERQLFERDFQCVPCASTGGGGSGERMVLLATKKPQANVYACRTTPVMASALRAESRAEARRFARMLGPARQWMPGGPLNSASGRLRLMARETARLQRLHAIVSTATRALQHASIENWFPPVCLAAQAAACI